MYLFLVLLLSGHYPFLSLLFYINYYQKLLLNIMSNENLYTVYNLSIFLLTFSEKCYTKNVRNITEE